MNYDGSDIRPPRAVLVVLAVVLIGASLLFWTPSLVRWAL